MDPWGGDATQGPSAVSGPTPAQGQGDVGTAAGTAGPISPPGYGTPSGPQRSRPRTYNPGDVVAGDFRIEAKLGEGGMGVVYRGRHLLMDRVVALKIHRTASPDDAFRIEREAKAMARFRHPNVIGVYDVRRDGDALIIAMEYLDGGTLRTALESPLPWKRKLELCLMAGDGLAAAHKAGLVHRDFKPDNVLLSSEGRVVVADFGLARAPGPLEARSPSRGPMPTPSDLDGNLTATGALLGTPAYMAPEQFEGSKVDAAADQFAFCVVLYEALYGRRPFPGHTPAEILYSVTTGAIVMPPRDTEVPEELWQAVLAGLSRVQAQRHSSMAVLLHAVRRILRAPARRTLRIAVTLATVLFAVVAVLLYFLYGHLMQTRDRLVAVAAFDGVMFEVVLQAPHPDDVRAEAEGIAYAEARAKEERVAPQRDELVEMLKDPAILDDPERMAEAFMGVADDDQALTPYLRGLMQNPRLLEPVPDGPVSGVSDDDEGYTAVVWDGKSTLTCSMGDRLMLRGVKARIKTGPAIQADMQCRIRVIDCDIEADTIVAGTMPTEVLLEGGRLAPRVHLVNVTMPKLIHIRDVTIKKAAAKAAVFLDGAGGVARIEGSTLRGDVALKTSLNARVEIEDSRLIGSANSIEAGMRSQITLLRSEVDGPVETGPSASVKTVEPPE